MCFKSEHEQSCYFLQKYSLLHLRNLGFRGTPFRKDRLRYVIDKCRKRTQLVFREIFLFIKGIKHFTLRTLCNLEFGTEQSGKLQNVGQIWLTT